MAGKLLFKGMLARPLGRVAIGLPRSCRDPLAQPRSGVPWRARRTEAAPQLPSQKPDDPEPEAARQLMPG